MAKFKLDKVDRNILETLIRDARTPYTDIAKRMKVSSATIHVRVKKLEDHGIITGSSIAVDYPKLGYTFTAFVGVVLQKTSETKSVIKRVEAIPNVTAKHITTGKFHIFCKIRARDTAHAKDVIYQISDIDGVVSTETMISLEECVNDKGNLIKEVLKG